MKHSRQQPELFAVPPQPRKARREDPAFYYAVRLLRRNGARVYRAGRDHHSVDGARITTRQLLALAGAA